MTAALKRARQYPAQVVHFLRKGFTEADAGNRLTVGVIPAGSLILKPASGVHIVTAGTFGTNNLLDVGFRDGVTDDDNYLGTALSLTATNFVPLDETVGLYRVANNSEITCTPNLTGTAGVVDAECVIAYIPDTDG